MDSAGITILGSVQINCAPMSVELSNLNSVLLGQAHTRVHCDDVLREMFGKRVSITFRSLLNSSRLRNRRRPFGFSRCGTRRAGLTVTFLFGMPWRYASSRALCID